MKKTDRRAFIDCLFEQYGKLVIPPGAPKSNWCSKNPVRVGVDEVVSALQEAGVHTLHGICYGQKLRITSAALRPLQELLELPGVFLERIDIGAYVSARQDGIIVARPLPQALRRLERVSTAQILHGCPLLPLQYNGGRPDNNEPDQNFGWLRGRLKVKTAPYTYTGRRRRTSRRFSQGEQRVKSDKVALDFKCYSAVRHLTQQAQARKIFKKMKKKALQHNSAFLPYRKEGSDELQFAEQMHCTLAGAECKRFLKPAKQRIEVSLDSAVINCASRAASSAPHAGDVDLGADICPVLKDEACSALVKHIVTIARVSSPCTSTYQPNPSPLCYPKPTS